MSDPAASEPPAAPDPAEAEIAVVIVNYNAGDYLDRCLASLAEHRGPVRMDVLVIDNDSLDASHTRAVAAHPWARLIENRTNVFLSPAWNQGIRETKAPHVLLMNPDAEIWSGTLADYLDVARTHPRVGVVGPKILNPDGTVYPSGRPFPSLGEALGHAVLGTLAPNNRFTRRYRLEGWDRSTERAVDWVSGSCMLMPRRALEDVNGFDEEFPLYGEELDITTRLRDAGWSVLFTPAVEVIHQIGVSTGRSRSTLRMHSDSIYRYYRKHRARGWRRVTLPFAWTLLRLRAELEWIRGSVMER